MRFYLKLGAMIAVFLLASRGPARGTLAELRDVARVTAVVAFGSEADYQALVDDTHRELARETGNLSTYYAGKEAERLFACHVAAAARRNIVLRDEQKTQLRLACQYEASCRIRHAPPYEKAHRQTLEPCATRGLAGASCELSGTGPIICRTEPPLVATPRPASSPSSTSRPHPD